MKRLFTVKRLGVPYACCLMAQRKHCDAMTSAEDSLWLLFVMIALGA